MLGTQPLACAGWGGGQFRNLVHFLVCLEINLALQWCKMHTQLLLPSVSNLIPGSYT